jgi:hypothetical protein
MAIDYVQNVTLEVELPTLVNCEHCGTEYIYQLKLVGGGSASILSRGSTGALDAAESQARKGLQQQLIHRQDVVPCPKCFHYQPHMYRAAGMRRFQWLMVFVVVGVLVAFAGFGFYLVSRIDNTPDNRANRLPALLVGLTGLALCLGGAGVQRLLAGRYDPNTQSERQRAAVAGEKAQTFERFQKHAAGRIHSGHRDRSQWTAGKSGPPFDFEVWLKEEDVVEERPVEIPLPRGQPVTASLDPDTEPGTVVIVNSANGTESYRVKVRYFHRIPGTA